MAVFGHETAEVRRTVPARMIGLDELAGEADIMIDHLPLADETRHLVDVASLARLRLEAFSSM